jgi:hypothetical protein
MESLKARNRFPSIVTPGLDPGVHMDCRVKPGNDGKREGAIKKNRF